MAAPVEVSGFGVLLREHRLAAGLTQAALGERAGLSERTVQDLERGVSRPLPESVRRLVVALEPTAEACVQFEAAISVLHRRARSRSLSQREAVPPAAQDTVADARSLRTLGIRPGNLPFQPTSLIGRDQDVRAVTSLLLREDVRMVTLTGPGGSGKTRLGLEVAADLLDRFEDGVFLVELAPISDPSLVLSTIAQVLGVEADVRRRLLDVLIDYVRCRQLLLVIDNFEQVLAAATVPDTLLRSCPRLRVLVTSRAALQLRGEHEYPVPPLALPDPSRVFTPEALSEFAAVSLFIERATAIKPDFALTDANAPVVAEICVRLDGLPLAIELAAARIRLLSPESILPRLSHSLALLNDGRRDMPARQQTLRSAIAWSFDLLSTAEQRLFRHLSVFVGGFTLEAAEAVWSCDPTDRSAPAPGIGLLDMVGSLVDNNLVRSEELLVGEPRFRMLETIREFGREQLAATDDETSVRRRHLAWFADFAEHCQPGVLGPEGPAWLDRMAVELDNLRAALAWSLTDPSANSARTGLRIAGATMQLWYFRDYMAEGQRWLEQTLAADGVQSPNAGAETTLPAARLGAHGVHPRVIALNTLGILRQQLHGWAAAEIPAGQAHALAGAVLDRRGEVHALITLGGADLERGEYECAATRYERGLSIARTIDDHFLLWRSLSTFGYGLSRLGQHERARLMLEESLAVARSMGALWHSATSHVTLARVAFEERKFDRATAQVEESLPLLKRVGDPQGPRLLIWILGVIALANDDRREAAERFAESLSLSLQASRRGEIARCLEGLVGAVRVTDTAVTSALSSTTAACLLGAAASLREATGDVMVIFERPLSEQVVATIRTSLSEDAYATAFAEGRAMPTEWTIEQALKLATAIQATDT